MPSYFPPPGVQGQMVYMQGPPMPAGEWAPKVLPTSYCILYTVYNIRPDTIYCVLYTSLIRCTVYSVLYTSTASRRRV